MAKDHYQTWLQAIRQKLDAVCIEAEPLVSVGKFDDAEILVRRVESDIYGAVALGALFTHLLEQHVSTPTADPDHAKALFDRAMRWRCA